MTLSSHGWGDKRGERSFVVGGGGREQHGTCVGKLFSGKATYIDGIAQSLGKIRCSLKGI